MKKILITALIAIVAVQIGEVAGLNSWVRGKVSGMRGGNGGAA